MSSTAKYSRLETVWAVFQEHLLPRGLLRHRGERVDLSAIERTAVLTVEAELDDMCAPGQTTAGTTCSRTWPTSCGDRRA